MDAQTHGLELKIPPLIVLAIIAFAMWLVARATPQLLVIYSGRIVAAGALALLGVAAAGAGVVAFSRERTTVNPHTPQESASVVTGGIYRWTRNPMYLGMLLALLGWTVYLANVAAAAGPILFIVYITRYQIVPEERILATKFGTPYEAYLKSVRRWL
jgi:protein-S-isoprenylcysteine O-methyltransferase Ste14